MFICNISLLICGMLDLYCIVCFSNVSLVFLSTFISVVRVLHRECYNSVCNSKIGTVLVSQRGFNREDHGHSAQHNRSDAAKALSPRDIRDLRRGQGAGPAQGRGSQPDEDQVCQQGTIQGRRSKV